MSKISTFKAIYFTICTIGSIISAVDIGYKFNWIFVTARLSIIIIGNLYSSFRDSKIKIAQFLLAVGGTHRFVRESFTSDFLLGHEIEFLAYSLPLYLLN